MKELEFNFKLFGEDIVGSVVFAKRDGVELVSLNEIDVGVIELLFYLESIHEE